jgi:hypothetical protein
MDPTLTPTIDPFHCPRPPPQDPIPKTPSSAQAPPFLSAKSPPLATVGGVAYQAAGPHPPPGQVVPRPWPPTPKTKGERRGESGGRGA